MATTEPTPVADPVLSDFHPAVASWFTSRFPGGPTKPQQLAWPAIREGGDVLVASPTGTGKTLTGFLVAIDAAYRAHDAATNDRSPDSEDPPAPGPGVVYVSPLRALAVDVHENLQIPLAGIAKEAERLGLDGPTMTVAVRTGDTPQSERAAMRRSPPDLLVTTPESLYLLVTAASSRAVLANVHTVIVDEVHTLARDKRGSHLAITLERLGKLVESRGGRLQRIGLSATQRPLELVARLLSGGDPTRRPTTVIDCGHRRDLDVAIELPESELESVASGGQFSDVLDRIAGHVLEHRTTLVFVNTRKMAERVAHLLAQRLEDNGAKSAARHRSAPNGTGPPTGEPPARAARSTRPSRLPPTTAASRRRAGASSRNDCGPATSAPSWRRPRSSSGSTSDRSSWSARSARRGPSAPFSSGSAGPTTSSRGHPPAASIRSPATNWSSAPPCSPRSGPVTSTSSSRRSHRSTCWPNRSSPRSPRPRSTKSTRSTS